MLKLEYYNGMIKDIYMRKDPKITGMATLQTGLAQNAFVPLGAGHATRSELCTVAGEGCVW